MRKLAPLSTPSAAKAPHSPRHESAVAQVTGQARYVDDHPEPAGMLYACIGISPVAAGHIRQLDLSAVRASPGVIDVITAGDVPGELDIAPIFDGDPLLAQGEVKFAGQAVFAVAARSQQQARRAARRAHLVIDETEPLLRVDQSHAAAAYVRPPHTMARGDVYGALRSAPHTLSGELNIGGQEHFYLEGQVALAVPGEEGQMLVYSSTQHPSEVQKLVADVLGIRLHKVVVDMRRMGGGFGGKESQAAQWACLAAVLAVRTGRAVKCRLPRSLDMQLTGKRHEFVHRYQVGFDATGRLLASRLELNGRCGHSCDLSDAIVDRAMFHADNAYYLGAAEVTGHRCMTHTVSNTAFRGFGGPQGLLLAEGVMDDIARELGLDPLTVRLRNLYARDRDETHYGMTVNHARLHELIDQLAHSAEYWSRRQAIRAFNRQNPVLKRGLALTPVKFGISFTAQHLNQAGALIHIYTDGSLQVNHGGTEMGQGLHTKIAQIVARELGVSLDQIEVTATRTDKIPNTSPTAASSGTDLNGKAAQQAAQVLKQRLVDFLADHYALPKAQIRFSRDRVQIGEQSLSFAAVVQQAYLARVQLSATGFYKTPKIHYDRSTGKGQPFFYFAYGASVSEVTIDTLTGEYRVDRVDILHDVGTSLNPAIDIGQIEGGFIQGMGWLTSEELKWDDRGRLLTVSPATYKIPAMADLPAQFNVTLFDRPCEEDTIYFSKAVGEPPLMLASSVWCALRDALSSLADYRHNPPLDPPATPEKVLAAVQRMQASQLSDQPTPDTEVPV